MLRIAAGGGTPIAKPGIRFAIRRGPPPLGRLLFSMLPDEVATMEIHGALCRTSGGPT